MVILFTSFRSDWGVILENSSPVIKLWSKEDRFFSDEQTTLFQLIFSPRVLKKM
jgi:hypothetical protein